MYQPKIRDDLIKRLYQVAKFHDVPMTRMINEIMEIGLGRFELRAIEIKEIPLGYWSDDNKGGEIWEKK